MAETPNTKNKGNLSEKKKKLIYKVKTSIATAKGVVDTVKKTADNLGVSVSSTGNGQELVAKNSNVIGLVVELLTLVGVNKETLIEFLSKYLTYILPILEVSVKTIILTNLKGMVSCSSDPRIPEMYRKYNLRGENSTETNRRGIDINVESIDLQGTLSMSPFGEGKKYYFGVDNESVSNAYQLARADDFDAFLWFVIHKAKFPSPSIVNDENLSEWFTRRYKQNVTLNNTNDTINIGYKDKNGFIHNDVSSLFQNIVINYPEPKSITGQTTCIMPGNTFVQKKDGKYGSVIGLCISSEMSDALPTDVNNLTLNTIRQDELVKTKYIARSEIVPVSDDWTSANWYVNPKRYFYQNLGLDTFAKKSNKIGKGRNYAQEKPICNLQFFGQESTTGTRKGIVNNQIRLTILPKPLLHIPEKGEPIWRFQRIMFNDKGEPDSKGKFSIHPGKFEKIKKEVTEVYKITSASDYPKKVNGKKTTNPIKAIEWIEVTNGNPYPTTVEIYTKEGNVDKLAETLKLKPFQYKYHKLSKKGVNYLYFIIEPEQKNTEKSQLTKPNISDGKLSVKTIKLDSVNTNNTVEYCLDRNPKKIGISIDKKTGRYKVINTKNPEQDILPYLQEVYKGLTIYEFNYDLVMGMKLFDAKCIITRLLDTTLKCNFGGSIRYSRERTQKTDAILRIVKNIIESDDTELKDCYYTFSNEEYDDLLERAENEYHDFATINNTIIKNSDFSGVLKTLDKLTPNTTLHEQKDILKRSIVKASGVLTQGVDPVNKSKLEIDFINDLLKNLITSIINSILTPKLLMVILVNQKIMGHDIQLINIDDVIKAMGSIIRSIVREIRDAIVQELLKLLLKQLAPITKLIGDMLLQETLGYYRDLMRQIIDECDFSMILSWFKNKYDDTNTGVVDYADIDVSHIINEAPLTNDC